MKLIDLNPKWIGHGGEGVYDKDMNPILYREKIGIIFDCPCGGKCGENDYDRRVCLMIENPPDGQGPVDPKSAKWKMTGDSFENMTLRPSILRLDKCKWHGFLTNGAFKEC